MKMMNVAAILAAGLMMAGCETTGAGAGAGGMGGAIAQAAVAAGTQAAIGSAVPGAAPAAAAAYAPGSYANDPVAIAYAQQQAAKQGVSLTPEQAALALQMAEQQQAGGANVNANVMAEAAARQAAAAGFAQQAAAAGIPLGAAIMGQGVAATVTPAVASATAPAAGIPDGQKSCEQLGAEIGEQQKIIAAANDSATNAQVLNAGVGIAQSLGMHFGGFGLGGIQAAGAAGNAAAQQGQAAQQQAQQAEIRLQVLTGIYQGKGCAA